MKDTDNVHSKNLLPAMHTGRHKKLTQLTSWLIKTTVLDVKRLKN